jgi:hypothetical protein
MRDLDFKCPRCNSNQKFARKKREVKDDYYEIYIMCSQCRWQEVVISGDSDTLHNHKEIQRLRGKAKLDPKLRDRLTRLVAKEKDRLEKSNINKEAN